MLVDLIKSQLLFASLKLRKCGRFARVEAPFKSSVSIVALYPEIGEEFDQRVDLVAAAQASILAADR